MNIKLIVGLCLPLVTFACWQDNDQARHDQVTSEQEVGLAKANEALVRKYIDAGREGDMETLRTILADDVVMHFHGKNPLAGENKGREAAWKKLQDVWGPLKLEFQILEVQDLLVNEKRAVLLMKVQIKSPEKTVESNRVDIYRIDNNKIVELWVYDDDQYAVDELFKPKK